MYDSIRKYSSNPRSRAKADIYLGAKDDFESDYPFSSFYKIYDYYRKYGLYKEQKEIVINGADGKIFWKKTIEKSQAIISNGNMIFFPLYVKKNNMLAGFITDCMAFVIDYTINHFSDFITLPKTRYRKNNFDYFNNIDYVLNKLYDIKGRIHKDLDKILLDNLILFFKQYEIKCRGGSIHVKINYFDMVWQSAVENYLNSYYCRFDNIHNCIIFDTSKTSSTLRFEKKTFMVDDSKNKFEIELDHYGFDGSILYILDSKYYYELGEFNYKQYSYNELLRYSNLKITDIISVLILPGNMKSSDVHFSLKPEFKGLRKIGNHIYEQYLDVGQVLKNYVK